MGSKMMEMMVVMGKGAQQAEANVGF